MSRIDRIAERSKLKAQLKQLQTAYKVLDSAAAGAYKEGFAAGGKAMKHIIAQTPTEQPPTKLDGE